MAAIASEFEPGVAKAILRGLYERFRIDPRLTPAALKLYVDTVHVHFPKLLTP